MQESINQRMDRMVKDIRSDVSEIKAQIERYNDGMEEMQVRISNVEDQVENFQEVATEVNELRELLDNTLSTVNAEANRARKNNFIIHGLPGDSKDPIVALKDLGTFCTDTLKLDPIWVKNLDVNEAYRFPPKGDGPWPLFVSLSKALVTSGIRPPCGLFAGSLRPKTVAIAGSPCGCLKELASTVEVVRSKISGRGP